MRPWTDAEITERNKEIEEGIRQCNVALKDLDKPTAGHRHKKENTNMDPISAWEKKVREYQERGLTEAKAIRETVVNFPDVHKAYLVAFNAMHGRVL